MRMASCQCRLHVPRTGKIAASAYCGRGRGQTEQKHCMQIRTCLDIHVFEQNPESGAHMHQVNCFTFGGRNAHPRHDKVVGGMVGGVIDGKLYLTLERNSHAENPGKARFI
jgi:hypothetical protein